VTCACAATTASILLNGYSDLIQAYFNMIAALSSTTAKPAYYYELKTFFDGINDTLLHNFATALNLDTNSIKMDIITITNPQTENPDIPYITSFNFLFTYGCPSLSPTATFNSISNQWQGTVKELASWDIIQKYWIFPNNTSPSTSTKSELEPVPPTLPAPSEEFHEPQPNSSFIPSSVFCVIILALVLFLQL